MFTVRNFLSLGPFKQLQVVSGEKGLDNVISSINIMDNPDALDWFSAGEMLLTSGYFFKDSEALQNKVIKQLHSINCPALCIKPQRYLGKIPKNMIEISNQLGIPIIELPYGIPFSKYLARVMEELSGDFDKMNQQSLDIHNDFFTISLHGGGMDKISHTLAELLDASILLFDQQWRLLSYADSPNRNWHIQDHMALTLEQRAVSTEFISQFPPDFTSLQAPIVRTLTVGNASLQTITRPTSFHNFHYGYIMAVQPAGNWTNIEYIALENGAMVFALEQVKNAELNRAKNRVRRNFFDELLSGNISSKESLVKQASLHDVPLELRYTAIVMDVAILPTITSSDVLRNNIDMQKKVKMILGTLDEFGQHYQKLLLIFSKKDQIIVLVGESEEHLDQARLVSQLAEELIQLVEKNVPEVQLKCGIGNQVLDISTLHRSFFEAQESLRLSSLFPIEARIFHFQDLYLQHFLSENISEENMLAFCDYILGPLLSYDKKNNTSLMETLESLVHNQLNISETARALFIHRNTLLYRIERIEAILNLDFKQTNKMLEVQLAFNFYHLTASK